MFDHVTNAQMSRELFTSAIQFVPRSLITVLKRQTTANTSPLGPKATKKCTDHSKFKHNSRIGHLPLPLAAQFAFLGPRKYGKVSVCLIVGLWDLGRRRRGREGECQPGRGDDQAGVQTGGGGAELM